MTDRFGFDNNGNEDTMKLLKDFYGESPAYEEDDLYDDLYDDSGSYENEEVYDYEDVDSYDDGFNYSDVQEYQSEYEDEYEDEYVDYQDEYDVGYEEEYDVGYYNDYGFHTSRKTNKWKLFGLWLVYILLVLIILAVVNVVLLVAIYEFKMNEAWAMVGINGLLSSFLLTLISNFGNKKQRKFGEFMTRFLIYSIVFALISFFWVIYFTPYAF